MAANLEQKMEELLADTQENTQNTPLSKGQVQESQPMIEKEPWGRLYKKQILRRRLGTTTNILYEGVDDTFFDVRGYAINFGRDVNNCEYVFEKNDRFDLKTFNRISKLHFVLLKDLSSEDSPVQIKDLSRNGTFLNGELIGQNQQRLITTEDVISIIEPDMKVFGFKDLTVRKIVDLPTEVQQKFFVCRKVGSGAFGEVYKLLDRDMNPYAVKYIKACSVGLQQTKSVTDNEIKIMKKLKHVCIIETIDIIKDHMGGASLILEFMEGGDLLNRIVSSPDSRLSENQTRFMFFQVTEAVNYLHSKGITHRDIKPDNVLLKDSTEWPLVKLTDFGLSKLVVEGTVMKSLIGTPNYVAPEVLRADETKYTSKVDVWSMGVMLYAMLSGTLPFAESNGDVRKRVLTGDFHFTNSWQDVSNDARRLIRKMLVVEPEARINIQDILETPWMDASHEGVQGAVKILEEHGWSLPRIRNNLQSIQIGKGKEFVLPRPPAKKPRYMY